MDGYSDLIVACGITANASRAEIDAGAQRVMEDSALSLRAKGLFVLLTETGSEPHNPFDKLHEPAEAIHAAFEELIRADLMMHA